MNFGADLSVVLDVGVLATETSLITGNGGAAAQAAGYGAWVAAVTGSRPKIERIGSENRARMVLSEDQKLAMRGWLNRQVGSFLAAPGEPPVFDANLGPTLTPWALQYAAPMIIGAIVTGWLAHWMLSR